MRDESARGRKGGSTAKPSKRKRKSTARTERPDVEVVSLDSAATAEETDRLAARTAAGQPLTGGDVDADAERPWSSGEEAVGGSGATPDKDVVDEIGRGLGVEQAPAAPLVTSAEMLRERDARYWDLEWRAAKRNEGR